MCHYVISCKSMGRDAWGIFDHCFLSRHTHIDRERYGVIRLDCSDQILQEIPKDVENINKSRNRRKRKPKIHSCICLSVSGN